MNKNILNPLVEVPFAISGCGHFAHCIDDYGTDEWEEILQGDVKLFRKDTPFSEVKMFTILDRDLIHLVSTVLPGYKKWMIDTEVKAALGFLNGAEPHSA